MIFLSFVQFFLHEFLTYICVLVSVAGNRYAPCVSYNTKLIVIFFDKYKSKLENTLSHS